jgi:hypothetical protein
MAADFVNNGDEFFGGGYVYGYTQIRFLGEDD